jgi:peptidoglycan/xylan/chitin deacetylase (PgdA/CDA1 family)
MNKQLPPWNALKKILVSSRVLRWAAVFAPASVVILMYHSVKEEPELYADSIGTGIIHPVAVFRKQMEILARRFNPVPLTDVLLFVGGKSRLPPRSVVVTFDDGFADNARVAAPILNRFSLRAAFYLTAGLIGTPEPPWYCRVRYAFNTTKKNVWLDSTGGKSWSLICPADRLRASQVVWDRCSRLSHRERQQTIGGIERELDVPSLAWKDPLMMSWDEARNLQQMGHIVGSHTMTHPNLAHVTESEARAELVESKRTIERELGIGVPHFSYPHPALNPNWNARTVTLSKEAGYQTAVTTASGAVGMGTSPLALTRIPPGHSVDEFLWHLDCAFLGRSV